MKNSLRSSILLASALLITLALSSCGSDGKTVTATSTSFAYLQVNSTLEGAAALTSVQAHGSKTQSRAAHAVRAHVAGKRLATLPATVNIQAGSYDLYVLDTATTPLKPVQLNATLGSAAFNNVELSKDGTKLLVAAYDSQGYSQIYVADAKLQTITQLTGLTSADETDHLNASLSADGSTIVFDDNNGNLFTIPAAGGTATPIATTAFSSAGIYASTAVFTPDGKSLVFGDYDSYCIFLVSLDGKTLTQLSTSSTSENVYDYLPAVSADGTKVAFTRQAYDTTVGEWLYKIEVVGIAGESQSNPAVTLNSTANHFLGEVRYLGTKILYVDSSVNGGSIYEMNADGTSVAALTTATSPTRFNMWW